MHKGDTDRVIAGAVMGESLNTIAAATSLSRSSVQRRLRLPEVQAEVDRLRGVQRSQALATYGKLRGRALARLEALLDSENEGLALKAIGLALNSALHYERWSELEVRVHEIEQAVSENTAATGEQERW
jgi:hypothetical protein